VIRKKNIETSNKKGKKGRKKGVIRQEKTSDKEEEKIEMSDKAEKERKEEMSNKEEKERKK
jgi:hypothetical protein